MIREAINGFFMALADSVPGVSGGTVLDFQKWCLSSYFRKIDTNFFVYF